MGSLTAPVTRELTRLQQQDLFAFHTHLPHVFSLARHQEEDLRPVSARPAVSNGHRVSGSLSILIAPGQQPSYLSGVFFSLKMCLCVWMSLSVSLVLCVCRADTTGVLGVTSSVDVLWLYLRGRVSPVLGL